MAEGSFETITILELEAMGSEGLDELSFGVIGFNHTSVVELYNATESRMSGLASSTVLGAPFFDAVAQCMNNFMVAQRFEDEPELDAVVPFVLTLRMRPTRVRLRLLATAAVARRYILIER
ncbi:hypothetical protein [Acidisoma sp.]|uniref:hypothetical protein n=1 Tax=Acidisoma sp. TaxID=1872115 RepID=UPI003AFF82B4